MHLFYTSTSTLVIMIRMEAGGTEIMSDTDLDSVCVVITVALWESYKEKEERDEANMEKIRNLRT